MFYKIKRGNFNRNNYHFITYSELKSIKHNLYYFDKNKVLLYILEPEDKCTLFKLRDEQNLYIISPIPFNKSKYLYHLTRRKFSLQILIYITSTLSIKLVIRFSQSHISI